MLMSRRRKIIAYHVLLATHVCKVYNISVCVCVCVCVSCMKLKSSQVKVKV
jgi:hypothetical protein